MYVLMLVSAMIMLLALMTYGRLESFRGFAFLQSEFEEYMEKREREYSNEEAIKLYKETPATKQGQADDTEQEKNPASSKLSFNLFVNAEERAAQPVEFEQLVQMSKNLLYFLYSDQEFYKRMEEKRPNFLDEIFVRLMEATLESELNKTKEIATVDLGDLELNEVFTLMLKGSIDKKEKLMLAEQIQIIGEEEPIIHRGFKPVDGYYSLLDFITLEKNKLQIRVFLASPQLLMALFGNPVVVQNILDTRYELYRALVNEATDKETGSTEFKEQFSNLAFPFVLQEEMLDFGISKTNPRNYE